MYLFDIFRCTRFIVNFGARRYDWASEIMRKAFLEGCKAVLQDLCNVVEKGEAILCLDPPFNPKS